MLGFGRVLNTAFCQAETAFPADKENRCGKIIQTNQWEAGHERDDHNRGNRRRQRRGARPAPSGGRGAVRRHDPALCALGRVALMTAGLAMASPLVLSIAMIWLAHIGIDRALGYGLKYQAGFAFTHL